MRGVQGPQWRKCFSESCFKEAWLLAQKTKLQEIDFWPNSMNSSAGLLLSEIGENYLKNNHSKPLEMFPKGKQQMKK